MLKTSLLRNGFPSQKLLAEELAISQSTVSNFLNGRPVDFANFVEICRVLGQEWRQIAALEAQPPAENREITIARVAIRDRASKETLTQQLQAALTAAGHEIFCSSDALLPEDWQISDYLVLLLSSQALVSETLLQELPDRQSEKPAILPIWVELDPEGPLSFDLLSYLQPIVSWHWRRASDTETIVAELLVICQEKRSSLTANHELAIDWKAISGTQGSGSHPLPVAAPELPEGQVEMASRFYIDRPPIESDCYHTIIQPGALIRIKAPRQMGKTSLMARILHRAQREGSKTIALSLQLANQRVFANSDSFLQWFCASIGMELGMLDKLANFWQLAEIIGSNQCCKAYFEQCILPELSTSLTLGLDEVDRVFASPEIADDFFGLLRALHEEGKRRSIWKNLRLIVVHSTEVYIPLDANKSPFNVGLPIELPEFNSQQVLALAQRHGLPWQRAEVEELMQLVGGHPYLLRLGMYHLARQEVTLSQLVRSGGTEAGIYRDHLRRHLWNLEKYPELLAGMKEVVTASEGVRLRSELGFKLNSMGLVVRSGNNCRPRCQLYQQYFGDILGNE
ncbi:MAG: AAA-like domain-containing protein [Hormoscilla sp.]